MIKTLMTTHTHTYNTERGGGNNTERKRDSMELHYNLMSIPIVDTTG